MKVRELIAQLEKLDPEMEVMIQQGEEYDYMVAHSVRTKELIDLDHQEWEVSSYVVIEYY